MAVSGGVQAQAFIDLFGNEVSLGAPDDVMLVPHVICNTNATGGQVNTLVGINTIFPDRGRNSPARLTGSKGATRPVHWRFYDVRSNHRIDGIIRVSDNDFYRFDWCDQVRLSGQTILNNLPGYLLFHADNLRFNTRENILIGESILATDPLVRTTAPDPNQANRETYSDCAVNGCPVQVWESLSVEVDDSFARALKKYTFNTSVLVNADAGGVNKSFQRLVWLYGHSYLIQGNWASQAFIPVVTAPVWDTVIRNGFPAIDRLERGINFTTQTMSPASPVLYQDILVRYFLDPDLATGNRMVFWFNSNQDALRGPLAGGGAQVPGEVFDSEQIFKFSFSTALNNELNIIGSCATSAPCAARAEGGPAFPGMFNEATDDRGRVVNTGLIHFYVPQVNSTVPYISSGLAFNLLELGAGGNDGQIQTEMATGSYDVTGPF
jgi:hypothetical protein